MRSRRRERFWYSVQTGPGMAKSFTIVCFDTVVIRAVPRIECPSARAVGHHSKLVRREWCKERANR